MVVIVNEMGSINSVGVPSSRMGTCLISGMFNMMSMLSRTSLGMGWRWCRMFMVSGSKEWKGSDGLWTIFLTQMMVSLFSRLFMK